MVLVAATGLLWFGSGECWCFVGWYWWFGGAVVAVVVI
jgi:hypothetical protein